MYESRWRDEKNENIFRTHPSVVSGTLTLLLRYTRMPLSPYRATFHPLQMLIIAVMTIYLFSLREEFYVNQHNRMLKTRKGCRGNRNVIVLFNILYVNVTTFYVNANLLCIEHTILSILNNSHSPRTRANFLSLSLSLRICKSDRRKRLFKNRPKEMRAISHQMHYR